MREYDFSRGDIWTFSHFYLSVFDETLQVHISSPKDGGFSTQSWKWPKNPIFMKTPLAVPSWYTLHVPLSVCAHAARYTQQGDKRGRVKRWESNSQPRISTGIESMGIRFPSIWIDGNRIPIHQIDGNLIPIDSHRFKSMRIWFPSINLLGLRIICIKISRSVRKFCKSI